MNYSWGTDDAKSLDIMADWENANGGLDIGGKKYNIKFIVYDSKGSQTAGLSAVNRLIFEDKVKFILCSFDTSSDSYLPTTEENKVIFITDTYIPTMLTPDKHYCFNAGIVTTMSLCSPAWFARTYPDKSKIVGIYPDNAMGHGTAEDTKAKLAFFNKTDVTMEYYPLSSQDLSALGTKVTNLSPDVVFVGGGGAVLDSIVIKALHNAGFNGLLFNTSPTPAVQLTELVPPEALGNYACCAIPMEFDPPLTDAAKKLKDAWVAQYGTWKGQAQGYSMWSCLREALVEAGALDPDKISDTISNGMKFEGPAGIFQMVSRPDMGNTRTVDAAWEIYFKTIKDGKPVYLDTFSLSDGTATYQSFFKASSAGAYSK